MTARPPAGRHDPLEAFRGACRSCHAPILWADTANDERLPLDEKPTARGNVVIQIQPPAPGKPLRLTAGVLGRVQADGARANGVHLYLSHFATCPDSSRHRRSRSKTRRWRRS